MTTDTLFLHDAEQQTADYRRRHSDEYRRQHGVWRWKGIQRHKQRILSAVVGRRTIDFGGFDGPLGHGSVIVDPKCGRVLSATSESTRAAGALDCYPTLRDLPAHWWDTFFTSHTLEHVADLTQLLHDVYYYILRPGGTLIAHVPAYTCTRWRPENYDNAGQEPHLREFALNEGPEMPIGYYDDPAHCAIDCEIEDRGYRVDLAEHCGDDSIIVFATKPYPVPA